MSRRLGRGRLGGPSGLELPPGRSGGTLVLRVVEKRAWIHLRDGILELAHTGAEASRHRRRTLGPEEQHQHACEDDDLPDAESEGHPRNLAAAGARAQATCGVANGTARV